MGAQVRDEAGVRDGVSGAKRDRIKALEREVKGLRTANEILRLASALFAQPELDRRFKSWRTSSSASQHLRGRADL